VSHSYPFSDSFNDPAKVAWRFLAEDGAFSSDLQDICARCRVYTDLSDMSDIVAKDFIGWEHFNENSKGLCISCSWAYREQSLLKNPILLHISKGAIWATWEQLLLAISTSFPVEISLVLPVLGDKHLLPHAQWGCVISDKGSYPWDSKAASLTSVVRAIKAHGVNDEELKEPAPPYRIIATMTADTDNTVVLLRLWEQMLFWAGTPQLDIVLKIISEQSQ
jgi:hypothetical protein